VPIEGFLSGKPIEERRVKEMRKKKKLILALGSLFLLAASVGVLAGIGDDDGGASNVDVNNDPPGGGDGCICPMVYDPVVCLVQNPDGTKSKQLFSNACFAGCAGATECRSFAIAR
jgi:hypothetical protein